MEESKQDIRITKTHKALADALITLIEKKSFNKITVNDICQEALVSRSTFYLHFEDKYQLMRYCMKLEHQRLNELKCNEKDPKVFFQEIFCIAQEKKYIYRNFFESDPNRELNQMFRDLFHGFMVQNIEKRKDEGVELMGPISIVAAYYASGLAGVVIQWIKEDFKYSTEDMALCLYNLISNILPKTK